MASVSPAMRQLQLNGSDVDHFECPRCGANDRLRHLVLYLDATSLMSRVSGGRVLHFAPEKKLTERIVAARPTTYIRADIAPGSAEIVRVDMTAMQFADDSFDLLIANHVLEHVADLAAALREVARVLVPGGLAILQTPYSRVLHRMFEDPGVQAEDARLELYGQEDHVRLFGSDIAEHIAHLSGMTPCVSTHDELLGHVDFHRHGVNPHEPFLLFRKDV
jgi:SAM-dependent methyltransferase